MGPLEPLGQRNGRLGLFLEPEQKADGHHRVFLQIILEKEGATQVDVVVVVVAVQEGFGGEAIRVILPFGCVVGTGEEDVFGAVENTLLRPPLP